MLTKFGIQFREHRIRRGKIINDIAQLLSVSPSFVSACETGRDNFSGDQLKDIASYLQLLPEEFWKLWQLRNECFVGIINVE